MEKKKTIKKPLRDPLFSVYSGLWVAKLTTGEVFARIFCLRKETAERYAQHADPDAGEVINAQEWLSDLLWSEPYMDRIAQKVNLRVYALREDGERVRHGRMPLQRARAVTASELIDEKFLPLVNDARVKEIRPREQPLASDLYGQAKLDAVDKKKRELLNFETKLQKPEVVQSFFGRVMEAVRVKPPQPTLDELHVKKYGEPFEKFKRRLSSVGLPEDRVAVVIAEREAKLQGVSA